MLLSWQTREHAVLHCLSCLLLFWNTSLGSFSIFFLPFSAVLHGMKYKNSSGNDSFLCSIILLLHEKLCYWFNLSDSYVSSNINDISTTPLLAKYALIWKVLQLKTSWEDFKTKLQAQLVSIKHHSAYNPQCWCWHEDNFCCLEFYGIKNLVFSKCPSQYRYTESFFLRS